MFGAQAVCGFIGRAMARLKAFNARKTITLYYNCEEVAETLYVPLILKGEIMKTKITPILPVILIFCLAIGLSAQTKTGGEGIKRKAKTSAPARAPAKKPAAKTSPAPAPAAAVKKTEISSAAVITETPFETASKESKSVNPALRRQGADRFGQLRDPNAIPRLIELLNDPTGYIRAAAVDSLGLLRGGGDKATAKLCEMLAGDPDETVRQAIAISFSYIGDRKSEDCLVKAVNDKAAAVRYAAIRTIGTLRFLNAESELIKLVDSEDLQTRRGVIETLGRFQSKNSAGALIKRSDDGDKYVRQAVARALGEIGDAAAVPVLKTKLSDPDDSVRLEAALALAKLNDKSGLELAGEFAKSKEMALKQQSLSILSMIGDENSLKILDELYKTEQEPGLKNFIDSCRQTVKSRLKRAKTPL